MSSASNRHPDPPTGPMPGAIKIRDELLPSEGVMINGQTWFTVEAIAEHLGYAEVSSVRMLHRRAKPILDPLSILFVAPGSSRRAKARRFYNEEGVYQMILIATSPRARELTRQMLCRLQSLQADMATLVSAIGGRA